MTKDKSQPCGNKDCDKCYPFPHWKLSEHRIQHITYTRNIKAATQEEALAIFNAGTAWPSSYDDLYGEIVEQFLRIKQLPTEEPPASFLCYHDLPDLPETSNSLDPEATEETLEILQTKLEEVERALSTSLSLSLPLDREEIIRKIQAQEIDETELVAKWLMIYSAWSER